MILAPLHIVVMFFFAAFLAVITLYMWVVEVRSSPRYQIRKRMRGLASDAADRRFPADLRVELLKEMSPLDRVLFKSSLVRKLDDFVDSSGVKWDVKMVFLLVVASAVFACTLGLLFTEGMIIPLALIPVGAVVPLMVINYMRSAKVKKFTEQFPDALDMVSRSLKAGHSLSAAIEMVGTEMPEPVAGLFRTAYEEQALGLSMREALDHMSKRMAGTDVRFFVMATNIHREVGGNLGEILERLAHTIRERLKIRRQVRVYTAQARLSGYILAAVPFVMAAIFYVTLPGYIEEFFNVPWGIYALYLAGGGMVAGFFVIRKIVDIKI
ncbi:MAG: type II secretion system F family protein [Thermodesulfobacteriota bacterium]